MAPGVEAAARALAAGALVVYPTDTLLGLGARASRRDAVARLQRAKGRPSDQSISVVVSSLEEVERLAALTPATRRFLRRHLPGPVTVLLPPSEEARRRYPTAIAGGRAIGIRIPDHPVARDLARRVGPITATSANRHGEPPARTVAEARRAFGRSVRVYLPAVPRPSGRPSTLVDLTGARPLARARN